MSSTSARKMSPVEAEAEKQVYKELAKELNTKVTTKKKVMGVATPLAIAAFSFVIHKYTNIKTDSTGFYLLFALLFPIVLIVYGYYLFKKRKNHYLKILRKGYDTGQSSQSSYSQSIYSSGQSRSLDRKARRETLLSLLKVKEEDRSAVEESMKKMEESLKKNKDKMTIWSWMMIVPLCMFLLFAVLEKYADFKILESSNIPIFSALAIMFSFGLLMSTVTNAQKGRVRPFRGRSIFVDQWVRKVKNPKTFFYILSIRLVFAFAVCIGSVYFFLSSVF